MSENKENRECKNSVFVDLFYEDESAVENDIALYNALHDEPLPPGTTVEKIRVNNELYMNFKNDVSFGLGGKLLVFAEHQSTVNENMPLRGLLYIGRAYEQLVPAGNVTAEPEFRFPNHLEKRHEVLEKCPVLKDYSIFIDTIRKYQKQNEDDSYRKAIQECIENGVLANYLRSRGSEVVNMLMSEYNYEMDIQVQREEAFEAELHQATVETYQEMGLSYEDTHTRLKEKYHLTEEETQEIMKKNWR